jgi:hypothetical protein
MLKRAKNAQNVQGSIYRLLPDVLTAGRTLPLSKPTSSIPVGSCVVLDMRRLSLSTGRRRTTAVLEAFLSETGARFFSLQVTDRIGIRLYSPRECTSCFDEQVLKFAYSATSMGQRSWLACPGLDGRPCHSKGMKLFLPYDGCRFACADCHGLTRGKGRLLYRHGERLTALSLAWQEPQASSFGRAV